MGSLQNDAYPKTTLKRFLKNMGIYELNAELMAKKNQVISLNGEIARKNVEIACNLEQIKRKDEEIVRKNEEICRKDKEIALKNDEIAQKIEDILVLKGKLSQYRDLKEAFKQIEDLDASMENSPEKTVVVAEPEKIIEEEAKIPEKTADIETKEDNLEADNEESPGSSPVQPEQQQIDASSDNSQAPNQLPGLTMSQLQRWCTSSTTSSLSPINHRESSENNLEGPDNQPPGPLVPITPGNRGPGSLSSDLNSSNSDPDPRMIPDPRLIFHPSEDSIISGHGMMVGNEFLVDPQMRPGPMGPVLMGHPGQMRPMPMVPPPGLHPMQMRPTLPMMYHPHMGQQMYVQPGGQHPLKLTNRPPLGPWIRPVPVYPQMELQPIFPQPGEPMTD